MDHGDELQPVGGDLVGVCVGAPVVVPGEWAGGGAEEADVGLVRVD